MDTNGQDTRVSGTEMVAAAEGEVLDVVDEVGELMEGMSLKQMAAFEVLTNGGTIVAAARAAGVTRKTVHAWQEEGHRFAVAFEQWQKGIARTSRTRLLMVGEAATVVIARAIKGGDLKASLAVAKGMGLLSPPAVGEPTVQVVARKKQLEVKEVEARQADCLSATPFKDLVNVDGFAEEMREAEKREEGVTG